MIMKISKTRLQEMVKEALAEQLNVNGLPNAPLAYQLMDIAEALHIQLMDSDEGQQLQQSKIHKYADQLIALCEKIKRNNKPDTKYPEFDMF